MPLVELYVWSYVMSVEWFDVENFVSYNPPNTVISPKRVWQLFDVVIEGTEGQGAYALGKWEQDRRIGFRWNGTEDNPIGNPQSRGLPIWTMMDEALHESIVELLPPDKQSIACSYLNLKGPIELKVSFHPSGRYTLMAKEVGDKMFYDLKGDLFANDDRGSFYTSVSKVISDHMKEGRRVIFQDVQ